jgi:hypothetical protein
MMSLELLVLISRAGWTVEAVCCGRGVCGCAVAERLWRVRDEEGGLAEEVMDDAATAELESFLGTASYLAWRKAFRRQRRRGLQGEPWASARLRLERP